MPMADPLPSDPERALALTYAPPGSRRAFAALLALDDRLATIVRTTREPLVGQMRFTWWHAALTSLDSGPIPAEPLLQELAGEAVTHAPGAALATMVEGWEALLEPDLDQVSLNVHAEHRGEGLFAALGAVCGAAPLVPRAAGRGWALADLSRHLRDPLLQQRARVMACDALSETTATHWPPALRAVGALTQTARMDLVPSPRPHGHPARTARLLWLRLSGR